jgi:hypothetical protein
MSILQSIAERSMIPAPRPLWADVEQDRSKRSSAVCSSHQHGVRHTCGRGILFDGSCPASPDGGLECRLHASLSALTAIQKKWDGIAAAQKQRSMIDANSDSQRFNIIAVQFDAPSTVRQDARCLASAQFRLSNTVHPASTQDHEYGWFASHRLRV